MGLRCRLRNIMLTAVALITLALVVLLASSRLSLDADYRYTQAAERLPVLTGGPPTGLVQIRARGMSFRARVAGLDGKGPALILLHGFPETSMMWEPLLTSAANAGFRVVAFDQRGYSPLARPAGTEAYRVPELTEDLLAVADAVGFDRFDLVGHDWGAVVGWATTGHAPERVRSFVALSIPHPSAIQVANKDRGMPAYMQFFRMSGIAETFFTAGKLALMRNGLYASMPSGQLNEYLSLFSEPGALQAAFNWYRAIPPIPPVIAETITQPVLYLFGSRDLAVWTRAQVRAAQPQFVTGTYREVELDAGHWLIQEQPEKVVKEIMSHLDSLGTNSD